ncbi:MAG: hypothetical protein P8R42_05705 [Candidatus Binatia bacterium]|nr:hypothetical protein [Candidatus Binatia bacterium]
MTRSFLVTSAAFVGLFLVTWVVGPLAVTAADPPAGQEILQEIRKGATAFEAEYVGSFSRRNVKATVRDTDSGEVKSIKDTVVDVWAYHGEHPIREIRECRVDGKAVDLEECVEKPQVEPSHRFFAEDAAEHYRLEYEGVVPWKGQPSHHVRLVPLEETTRHLKGDVYFDEETKRLVGMDVTLAAYPFGVSALSIDMDFIASDGAPVLNRGRSEVEVYVPLLANDRIVTEFTASSQRLLREREPRGD